MSTSLNVGFIGLGIMGSPMAGHLLKAGHKLFVNTVGPVPEAVKRSTSCSVRTTCLRRARHSS